MLAKLLSLRALAFLASVLGFVIASIAVVVGWQSYAANPPRTIQLTVDACGSLLMSALALAIVWLAGTTRANVAMALAISFVSLSDAWSYLQFVQWPESQILDMSQAIPFALGAGFFLRASQLFPRELTRDDLNSNTTLWCRFKPLRGVLIALLRPVAVWAFVIVIAIAVAPPFRLNAQITEALRMFVVALGAIYFHIAYRAGDAEMRRKVLWFLEAALSSIIIGMIVLGILAILGDGGSRQLRIGLAIGVSSINTLAVVTCLYLAVFYAGAVSPALAVRKTFVYGATIGLLLFVFAAVEALIVDLFTRSLGVNDQLASALFGATCGLAFAPLKRRVEALLRRIFPATTVADPPPTQPREAA